MKLVFVPLKDVFKECKGKRQFSIKKDAYRRFSSVSNEMQIGIKKIAALYEEWNWRSDIHSSKDGTLLERTITVTLPSGQTTSLTRYQSIDNKSGQAQDD